MNESPEFQLPINSERLEKTFEKIFVVFVFLREGVSGVWVSGGSGVGLGGGKKKKKKKIASLLTGL